MTTLVYKGREDPSTTISGLSLCGSSSGDPESFVREGPNMTTYFLVDKGREDRSTTISGLSLCGSSCGDPESFVREGPNMTTFFL